MKWVFKQSGRKELGGFDQWLLFLATESDFLINTTSDATKLNGTFIWAWLYSEEKKSFSDLSILYYAIAFNLETVLTLHYAYPDKCQPWNYYSEKLRALAIMFVLKSLIFPDQYIFWSMKIFLSLCGLAWYYFFSKMNIWTNIVLLWFQGVLIFAIGSERPLYSLMSS